MDERKLAQWEARATRFRNLTGPRDERHLSVNTVHFLLSTIISRNYVYKSDFLEEIVIFGCCFFCSLFFSFVPFSQSRNRHDKTRHWGEGPGGEGGREAQLAIGDNTSGHRFYTRPMKYSDGRGLRHTIHVIRGGEFHLVPLWMRRVRDHNRRLLSENVYAVRLLSI
jgi:hypothetical protein